MFDSGARLLAVAFSLAAAILAGRWVTELTAPRPVAELPSAPMAQPASNLEAISRLFGTGNSQSQALEGLRLTGVFAGSRGGGFATLHTRAGDVHMFQGDEVAPGVILKQIESDRVILLSSGMQKELRLNDGNAQAVTTPTSQVAPYRRRQPAQVEEQ